MGNTGGFSSVSPSTPVGGLGISEQDGREGHNRAELTDNQLQDLARNFDGKFAERLCIL